MGQITVEAADWFLLLRWPERDHVRQGASACSSSIALTAPAPFEATVPGLGKVGPTCNIDRALPAPLLWEPKGLEVQLQHNDGGQALALQHENPQIRASLVDGTGMGRFLSGTLDLSSRVGFLDLRFNRGGALLVELRLEIFPSKLTYREDFDSMLADLGARRIPQIVRLLPPTSVLRKVDHRRTGSLKERYRLFDEFFEPFERALAQVARQPHTALVRSSTLRPVERLRRPDSLTRAAARRQGGVRCLVGGRALPARLPDGHRTATFDTPANRFVARALRSMVGLLALIGRQKGEAWQDDELQAQLGKRRRDLRRWLASDFLEGLPNRMEAPDLVVQRSPGYRDVLRWYRRMLLAFAVIAGEVRMGIADLWYVYQLWCAVRVEREAEALLGPGKGELIPSTPRGPRLDGKVEFADGTVLRAQDSSASSVRGSTHRPDLVLELVRPAPRSAGEARFQVVLDAKYRLDWVDGAPRPPRDAINAIHRYRDAVVSTSSGRAERVVYGGAILFPHPDEGVFAAHDKSEWNDFQTLGIGAIPLVPGQGQLLRDYLKGLLHASAVRLDRLGPPYPGLPPKRRVGTVIVAPLRYGTGQLDQMREEGWYHLPARWNLAAHRPTHLAAYESGPDAAVRWIWPIEDWERVDDDSVARRARFGTGKAGGRPPYWILELGDPSRLQVPIEGYDWGPSGPMYVPLEVFDLADSVFLLRGDARHCELLRVLNHLREGCLHWEEGWKVDEPLVLDGRMLGRVRGDSGGFEWEIGKAAGAFTVDDLRRRAIKRVFDSLRKELEDESKRRSA